MNSSTGNRLIEYCFSMKSYIVNKTWQLIMIYNNSVFLIVSIINQIATREINMS